ncbi:MAG: tRNA pseudouridine(55) synthase TruB, partial [Xanthomonadales bacterium]|nr:tRNA pseudouridine(55) synthase TruB [Xanthomonadales bacterium]
NQALQRARRALDARKAGHTGSLDPLASGLLPLCFGEATKVSAYLLDSDKRYQVRARFGAATDTGDADGQVIEEGGSVPGPDRLEAALAAFRGPIEQVPPMYSALKHEGQRLYKLARQGKEVERAPRSVVIHGLELIEMDGTDAVLEVHCSKGTYVRTLVEDLARECDTQAHVAALRRLTAGPFGPGGLVSLARLMEAEDAASGALDHLLLPMDTALKGWPSVTLGADAAFYLGNGQAVQGGAGMAPGLVRIYGPAQDFLGLGEVDADGLVAPKRLLRAGQGQGKSEA